MEEGIRYNIFDTMQTIMYEENIMGNLSYCLKPIVKNLLYSV